jgi:hypothetical protein
MIERQSPRNQPMMGTGHSVARQEVSWQEAGKGVQASRRLVFYMRLGKCGRMRGDVTRGGLGAVIGRSDSAKPPLLQVAARRATERWQIT